MFQNVTHNWGNGFAFLSPGCVYTRPRSQQGDERVIQVVIFFNSSEQHLEDLQCNKNKSLA